jgi:hypothetical protein
MNGFKAPHIVALCLALLLACLSATSAIARESVRIGFVFDGPSEHNAQALALWQEEITRLLANNYDVSFPTAKTLTANFSIESVREANTRLDEYFENAERK